MIVCAKASPVLCLLTVGRKGYELDTVFAQKYKTFLVDNKILYIYIYILWKTFTCINLCKSILLSHILCITYIYIYDC
jgi:hypothetical protein